MENINWKKLNQDIQMLEEKHRGEKKLKPVYDRYNTRFWKLSPTPKNMRDDIQSEEERMAWDVNWCKFCRETFLLTRLYSLKAHLRGRRHMTRVKYDWMMELSYAGLKALYSKKTVEMYKLGTHDHLILDWTMEDQAELVNELLEMYSSPEPQLAEIPRVHCALIA